MILCYITRGYGPIRPAIDAKNAAQRHGWHFELIDGLPLVEAKNRAVWICRQREDSMLMVEDDMDALQVHWRSMDKAAASSDHWNVLSYAATRNWDGTINVHKTRKNELIYTGTCFLRIPYYIMEKMPGLIFQAYDFGYTSDGQEIYLKQPNKKHTGSDCFFWHHALRLDPRPSTKCIGVVQHIEHPGNTDHDHDDPYVITYY